MNNIVLANVFRFFGLLLVQGLILRQVEFEYEYWKYIHIFIYPLYILLLPLRTPDTIIVATSFAMGILVDLFYYTPGLHASTATFVGYFRSRILKWVEPAGKYNLNYSPTLERFGPLWFYRYAAILFGIHLFVYFAVEAFTHVYYIRVLLNTLVTFVFSFFGVVFYMRIFKPLD
ncbi:MAG: hypothetical protein IPH04_08115 [Saprospirales bacterium]|jgi:hypothetical protein|nr:hypothetical protein [Saprospirales bacterium]MBK6902765.1 hypothetical protein [Saprospirales bacterium]MBK7336886.1 hypothetical protein [Saprospirales bacterium]